MNPAGVINVLRAEAAKLPPPMQEGVWIRANGVRFQVTAGHDENGKPVLAWEAMDAPRLFFRPTRA